MYWYWSDDIARALLDDGRIDQQTAGSISLPTVAFRSASESILEAAEALLDDEEVPLAA